MRFPEALKSARRAGRLTQAELAERSGIARPNIATYEAGRREPLISTAVSLFTAAGATLRVDEPTRWRWTPGRRPYAVPSRLWRLPGGDALRRFRAESHLWWSGPPRTFDLADRTQRLRAYEIVLREGTSHDIAGIVDEVLLCEAWPDLVLPRELRLAWQPLIDGSLESAPQPVIAA